jgi:hypothetical protein
MPVKALIWMLAVAVSALSLTAQAQTTSPDKFSGKNMLRFCKAETGADYSRGLCAGVVYTTFAFAGYFEDSDKKFCPRPRPMLGRLCR